MFASLVVPMNYSIVHYSSPNPIPIKAPPVEWAFSWSLEELPGASVPRLTEAFSCKAIIEQPADF